MQITPEQIKRHRVSNNRTQAQAATLAGISTRRYQQIEYNGLTKDETKRAVYFATIIINTMLNG